MHALAFVVGLCFLVGGIAIGVLDALDRTVGLSTLIAMGALMGVGALLLLPTDMKTALAALADVAARFWRPPPPPGGAA